MSRQTGATAAAVLAALVGLAAQADGGPVPFSAQMVRHGPDGKTATGRMYIAEGRTRLEMTQQGREVVRIGDRTKHAEWILFPADKTYLERLAPPPPPTAAGAPTAAPTSAPAPSAPPSAETDPCGGMPGLTCRRVGVEDVNGRPAVKWEMSMTYQGQTLTGAQWLDVERALPLRNRMPNGETTELKLLGKETVEGRAVEKWETTTQVPNQPPAVTFQWYDPELKLAVRDELPGGYVSELKDIRIGPQPDSLFAVPEGYTRIAAPPGRGQAPQAPQPPQPAPPPK